LDVPPIALRVLSRTDRSEDLGTAVLETRERYSKIRGYFRELNECLESTRVPLREKAVEAAKLRRAVAVAAEMESVGNDRLTTAISFVRGANDVSLLKKTEPGSWGVSIGLSKLIGILVDAADTARWKFRLRPFHTEKEAYVNMASDDIRRAIKTHFCHMVSKRDRAKASGYQQLAEGTSKLFERVSSI
jgi:hypothetical protein